ncbi:MAG: c-type cytochrome domain-containing protein, partial [Bacteroidota bacterium]|nr:c-type cytochrome domain-containing protein [Bacteroidota bacterium]
MGKKKVLLLTISLVLIAVLVIYSTINHPVDYITQVKPILNKNCITCHGGVKRLSNFSLLFRSEALAKNKSGKPAIIPGDPDHSEMIRRLTLKDPEERMPYKHDPLSTSDIDILRRWIKQGAKWGDHWAYVTVKPVEVPKPKSRFFGLIPSKMRSWARNDIDYFVYDKLKEQDLEP